MSNLEIALELAGRGFPVYPLAKGTKIPLKNSHGFHDATTDIEQVKAWWAVNHNVALHLEPLNMVVIDIDQHTDKQTGEMIDGLQTFRQLFSNYASNEPLPSTYTERTPTGKGLHYFFKLPVSFVVDVPTLGLGIDVIKYGVPISPTVTDKGSYQPVGKSTLDDVAMCPTWLLGLLKGDTSKPFSVSSSGTRKHTGNMLDIIFQGVIDGAGRNEKMNKLIWWLLGSGATPETVESAIELANRNFSPPIEESQLKTMIRSVWNRKKVRM
ncbi:MAG: bifunctional DNA primase/polymerase [Lactobacillales bacterium]|jgi:hypothetical protein|nr:bifunctional DNA primase/polymerase [Lactobacillales bacterium]